MTGKHGTKAYSVWRNVLTLKKLQCTPKSICSGNPCTTEGTVIHMNLSILHSKNLRSATQSDAAWPLPVVHVPRGQMFPFSPSNSKNTTRICTLQ